MYLLFKNYTVLSSICIDMIKKKFQTCIRNLNDSKNFKLKIPRALATRIDIEAKKLITKSKRRKMFDDVVKAFVVIAFNVFQFEYRPWLFTSY